MDFLLEHINILLVFAITIQALLFAILLFRSRKRHPEKILGYYELVYFLTYSSALLYLTGDYTLFLVAYYFVIPFLATFPVLFFLFIKKLVRGYLQRNDILHFVFPAALLLTNLIILPFLGPSEKYAVIFERSVIDEDHALQKAFLLVNGILYPTLLRLQPFVYIILCLKEIIFLRKKIQEEFSYSKGINLRWAVEFLVIFTLLFVMSILVKNETFSYSFVLLVNLIIGIESIQFRNRIFELAVLWEKPDETEPLNDRKYIGSALTEEDKKPLYDRIQEYFITGKKYLDPDLRLTDVANALGTNRQYISQVINELSGNNFYHFVNYFRVKEFMEQYQSEQFKNKTIEGISSMVGFKSKSSFFNEFKRINGCTPKEFMKANP